MSKEVVELKSEIGSCDAIIDYSLKKANIQKLFFYEVENKKNYVGNCTLSKEIVDLEYDINNCGDERHDFERNVSLERGQYFYNIENRREKVGKCVDISKYTYPHFLDATTCKYNVVDGRILYRQRVAYFNLLNQKEFATDCEVTNAGGYDLIEEFAGYTFKDSSRQVIRKINTYFFIPGTKVKEYIDMDIETNKSYPYRETQCNIVNNDKTLITTFFSEINFEDTDENKIVNIQKCKPKNIIAYTRINGAGRKTYEGSLGKKMLTLKNGKYIFNFNSNIQSLDQSDGRVPTYRTGSYSLTSISLKDKFTCYSATPHSLRDLKISNKSCVDGTIKIKKENFFCTLRTTKSGHHVNRTWNYNHKYCEKYPYYENIGRYSVQTEYLRGDGTTYNIDGEDLFKIIR